MWEDLNVGWDETPNLIEQSKKKVDKRKAEYLELSEKYIYRRSFSELNLINMDINFKYGYSYNFITGGDIDMLSYLKLILRHQKLKYLLISTWCISREDILQIKEYLNDKNIITIDVYVGEIFPTSYKKEYALLKNIIPKGGSLKVFRNHSKILCGYGDEFYFAVQSSANINTNPRTENACIQINEDIFKFYKDYFDGIKSIL